MAPPPEYDKEPKAPDKSATNISCEETKTVHNLVNDQPSNSDNKSASTASNADVENNKLVETLDDGQLRALLDEAITYKCPKDREGKSSLFKELLEEVEQDEQASEAAARGAGAGTRCARAPPRPSRNRRALPHSNSLQDLVAALSAEQPPRRHRPAPAPAPAPVSARAIHGGSLPSGVDTSFLLGEEPMGGGYLATVRCVNPPPLNERRVSATDANAAAEVEMLTRRSKPASFPMTYTARATLEIGAVAARSPAAPAPPQPHPPAPAPEPVPAHQVPYPSPRRTRTASRATTTVTTSDPQWDFMHALTAHKKIVTEPDSMRKPNSKNDRSRKLNTGSTNVKSHETRDVRSSNENPDLPKPTGRKRKTKKRKTPGILNVPQSGVIEHESPFPKPQGSKNTQKIKEHRICKPQNINQKTSFLKTRTPDQPIKNLSTKKYDNKGYKTLPIDIPQRYNYANYVGPKLYSYRIPPTVGPPERLYTKPKLYNPRSRRFTPKTFKGFIPSEPENTTSNSSAISERFDENITSENENAIANMIEEQPLNDNNNLHSTLEDDSTDLNISLPDDDRDSNQFKLLNALFPKKTCGGENGGGRKDERKDNKETCGRIDETKKVNQDTSNEVESLKEIDESNIETKSDGKDKQEENIKDKDIEQISHQKSEKSDWTNNVNNWYDTLEQYAPVPVLRGKKDFGVCRNFYQGSTKHPKVFSVQNPQSKIVTPQAPKSIIYSSDNTQNVAPKDVKYKWTEYYTGSQKPNLEIHPNPGDYVERDNPLKLNRDKDKSDHSKEVLWMIDTVDDYMYRDYNQYNYSYMEQVNYNTYLERKKYRERVGETISRPDLDIDINPRNIRPMSIGKPLPEFDTDNIAVNECINENTSKHDLTSESDENILTTYEVKSDIFDSLSHNSNKTAENLDDIDVDSDKITNICVRASTPIADPNPVTETDNDIENTEESKNTEALQVQTEPKESQVVNIEDNKGTENTEESKNTEALQVQTEPKESQVVDIEDNKGTVHIPIINQTDYVDIDEGLQTDFYSFSQDKDERRRDTVEMVEITPKEENSICENLIKSFASKSSIEDTNEIELTDLSGNRDCEKLMQNEHELVEYPSVGNKDNTSFSTFVADQRRLFSALEVNDLVDSPHEHSLVSNLNNSEKVQFAKDELSECVSETIAQDNNIEESQCVKDELTNSEGECLNVENTTNFSKEVVIRLDKSAIERAGGETYGGEQLPNNAYVYLTLPQNLLAHLSNIDDTIPLHIDNQHTSTNNKPKKKKHPAVDGSKRREIILQKSALRALLFEKCSKSVSPDKSKSKAMSTVTTKEVDSTIPFSCITTPEVVASCNTTSSTMQSSVPVDPKPLQLAGGFRALASLAGAAGASPATFRPHPLACLCCRPAPAPELDPATAFSPRSVVSSSFNGLPLSRPNYGSTASTAQDEFKKSLDENGNSVQGYSSPLSGSSQHKKPRRKKSSKNETVIKSHQIDGYQGNKDLNEVLRFIESNAESTRAAGKLGRTKHKDDSDDKGGKKRSTERRKDKEAASKMKRATSMEELSRTKLEDLTDKPGKKERRTDAAPKAERRSWGDDARDSFYYEPEPADADFQTVTKKRKPRRRADEPPEAPEVPEPPPRPACASPRARRVSAPPSDRSNDSNDDMDSVHSLPADAPKAASAHAPAPAPPAPAPVSYADIARTRHNIPDLIESCNFYAEGEVRLERADGSQPPPADAEGYPALEPRGGGGRRPPHTPGKRAPPASAPPSRHGRKMERAESVTLSSPETLGGSACVTSHGAPDETEAEAEEPAGVGAGAGPGPAECPAPDVVADRRPPVILLDSACPHDMDGVTFGFDLNPMLLRGPTRRPRCDLVRDAIEGATDPADTNGIAGPEPDSPGESDAMPDADPLLGVGVGVVVGCAALRYVAPRPPADTTHLHQIIDYVGAAWDDVVRCGSGKVRYFSE